jgi:hypothetical protein
MSKRFYYEAACPDLYDRVEALEAMTETAVESSYDQMVRHCAGLLDWAVDHSYERHPNHGLTLKDDWHVAYYRSTFEGRKCYYLVYSAMEFIWCEKTT